MNRVKAIQEEINIVKGVMLENIGWYSSTRNFKLSPYD